MIGYIIAGIPIACLLGAILLYNRLVQARNAVAEGWSGIDVQLKRRYTLVPGLVECVRGYATHEMESLTSITTLRGATGGTTASADRQAGENELTGGLKLLLAVAEKYPDLKASGNFLDLQKKLVEIEDQIQYARRYYNGAVRDYNVRCESFPGILIARQFGFTHAAFFEIETASERVVPHAELGLSDNASAQ